MILKIDFTYEEKYLRTSRCRKPLARTREGICEFAIKELAKKNIEPISAAAGMEMAKRINAACYMECSAKTQNGLKEVFDEAIKVALNNKSASSSTEKKGCGCCIM